MPRTLVKTGENRYNVCGKILTRRERAYEYRSKRKGKGYCGKHYQQIKRKGEIYKTYKEPNDIILYDDYAEIIILDNKSNEVGRVKIDLDDVDRENVILEYALNTKIA